MATDTTTPTPTPPIYTSGCTCSAIGVGYPASHVCGGYVVRDPWSAVYPPAEAPKSFVYTSQGHKTEWTIDHKLGFRPNVTTYALDVTGEPSIEVAGTIKHINNDSLIVVFTLPVDGKAYLS